MRPDSSFLVDLNEDAVEILSQLKFTLLWTRYDLMIIPAQSSLMAVGKNIEIPVLVHAWMVKDQRVLKLVAELLTH